MNDSFNVHMIVVLTNTTTWYFNLVYSFMMLNKGLTKYILIFRILWWSGYTDGASDPAQQHDQSCPLRSPGTVLAAHRCSFVVVGTLPSFASALIPLSIPVPWWSLVELHSFGKVLFHYICFYAFLISVKNWSHCKWTLQPERSVCFIF